MADQDETPFLVLLNADSLAVLPATDANVIAALYSKAKSPPIRAVERLNLLAGMLSPSPALEPRRVRLPC
jgi:hypothetical protein